MEYVGQTFHIVLARPEQDAYRDQFDIGHFGYVVYDEANVLVVEEEDWDDGYPKGDYGWPKLITAIASDGRKFKARQDRVSYSGGINFFGQEDSHLIWQRADRIYGGPLVSPDGEKWESILFDKGEAL